MLGLEIAIIILLLGLNAFLSGSEIAIASSRKSRLRALADDGSHAAERVLAMLQEPSGFLSTTQVGVTLAGYFSSAVGAVSLVEVLSRWFRHTSIGFLHGNADGLALVIVTLILSFISIVFGELVPKTAALQQAERVALIVVRPLDILSIITAPAVKLLTFTTNGVLRLVGVHAKANMPSVTPDEFLVMIETAEGEQVFQPEEADLLEDAIHFGSIVARSVMVPRVDVLALDGETPLGEAVEHFFTSGFSRIPIYRDSLDTVIGILYVKDVFRLLWSDRANAATKASEAIRPAFFVPESKPIDELLAELRKRRTHMAICLDEFGGMAGLVTLEDLIEELVGEIVDEFDPGFEPFKEAGPNAIDVDGRVAILDLLDRLDLEPEDLGPYEAESVGGLVTDHLGRIPRAGDDVRAGVLRLTVRSMSGHRVGRVKVERVAGDAEQTNDEES